MKINNKTPGVLLYLCLALILLLIALSYSSGRLSHSSPLNSVVKEPNTLKATPPLSLKQEILDDLSDKNTIAPIEKGIQDQNNQLAVMAIPRWKQQGQLKTHLAHLKNKADKGDIDAKYIVAANLRYCFTAPIDDFALQAKLEAIADYTYAGEAIDATLEKFDYCSGINQDQRREFYLYFYDAAQNGSVAAQQTFADITAEFYMQSQGFKTQNREEYIKKRDAFKLQKIAFLEQAAKHGSEKALMKLSALYHSQQISGNSLAKSYALNRLMMEITENGELYNRYAWFEQRQYPQLSQTELSEANTIVNNWLANIYQNGSLYPYE